MLTFSLHLFYQPCTKSNIYINMTSNKNPFQGSKNRKGVIILHDFIDVPLSRALRRIIVDTIILFMMV